MYVARVINRWRKAAQGNRAADDGVLTGTSRIVLMGQSRPVSFSAFKVLFRSILWFSYRSNFPMLKGSLFNSDTGWGCMLRSLQMVIAQAFQRHYSSSEWNTRVGPAGVGGGELTEPEFCRATRLQIVEYFADDPSSPYSIHRLVELGGFFGKKPGEWYGPTLASHIARCANSAHLEDEAERSRLEQGEDGQVGASGSGFLEKPMSILCARDGVVDMRELQAYFAASEAEPAQPSCPLPNMSLDCHESGGSDGLSKQRSAAVAAAASKKSLLLLVPLRLGLRTISDPHLKMLRATLQIPQSVGFIGGSPGHSLYFVAADELGRFAYLDPHTTRAAIQPIGKTRFWQNSRAVEARALDSTRPTKQSLRFLPGSELDPTLALAFFFDSQAAVDDFLQQSMPFCGPDAVAKRRALFVISSEGPNNGNSPHERKQDDDQRTEDLVASCMFPSTSFGADEDEASTSESEDEYVFVNYGLK